MLRFEVEHAWVVYKGKLKQIILNNVNSHSGVAEKNELSSFLAPLSYVAPFISMGPFMIFYLLATVWPFYTYKLSLPCIWVLSPAWVPLRSGGSDFGGDLRRLYRLNRYGLNCTMSDPNNDSEPFRQLSRNTLTSLTDLLYMSCSIPSTENYNFPGLRVHKATGNCRELLCAEFLSGKFL